MQQLLIYGRFAPYNSCCSVPTALLRSLGEEGFALLAIHRSIAILPGPCCALQGAPDAKHRCIYSAFGANIRRILALRRRAGAAPLRGASFLRKDSICSANDTVAAKQVLERSSSTCFAHAKKPCARRMCVPHTHARPVRTTF